MMSYTVFFKVITYFYFASINDFVPTSTCRKLCRSRRKYLRAWLTLLESLLLSENFFRQSHLRNESQFSDFDTLKRAPITKPNYRSAIHCVNIITKFLVFQTINFNFLWTKSWLNTQFYTKNSWSACCYCCTNCKHWTTSWWA